MNIGIIGAGNIAITMANTVPHMKEDVTLLAVASRSAEKAASFAKEHNIPKSYGSYESLVQDPEIDLVYIATPHSHHYEHMKLCLAHGKHVLCEKSFTMNAAQAREIIALAQEKHLYVAEAIWTRYLPSRMLIDQTVASGIIGKVTGLTANLSYAMTAKQRVISPELAGGALLDVGVYPLNFAFMHFGKGIERIESSVQLTQAGVDGFESMTLFYRDGRTALLSAGIYARSDRKGIFWGEKGYIVVENINNPNAINVFDSSDMLIKSVEIPPQITGFEYEVAEAARQIAAGQIQSMSMPLEETLYVMDIMDGLRRKWNVIYPQEK